MYVAIQIEVTEERRRPLVRITGKRICRRCGYPLSSYNPDPVCFRHPEAKKKFAALATAPPRTSSERSAALADAREIIYAVCKEFGANPKALFAGARGKSMRITRQVSAFVIRRKRAASYPTIGRALKEHHTTIMHSCKRVSVLMRDDERIRNAVKRVMARLA